MQDITESAGPTRSDDNAMDATTTGVKHGIVYSLAADFRIDHWLDYAGSHIGIIDSLPWALPTTATGQEDFTFNSRNIHQGVYTYLLNELVADEKNPSVHGSHLAFAEVGIHYHAFAQEYGPHKTYRMRKNDDHLFKGFGQVMPTAEGTTLGAMGNHYSGPFGQVRSIPTECVMCSFVTENFVKRNKIFDGTSVRPSIVVGPPTNASNELIRYYNNQIININQVVEGEEIIDNVRIIPCVLRTHIFLGYRYQGSRAVLC